MKLLSWVAVYFFRISQSGSRLSRYQPPLLTHSNSISLEVYGAKVTHLRAPIGSRPSLEDLEQVLTGKKYKMVTVTHVDTS